MLSFLLSVLQGNWRKIAAEAEEENKRLLQTIDMIDVQKKEQANFKEGFSKLLKCLAVRCKSLNECVSLTHGVQRS